MGSSSPNRFENKKCLSCHHPVFQCEPSNGNTKNSTRNMAIPAPSFLVGVLFVSTRSRLKTAGRAKNMDGRLRR